MRRLAVLVALAVTPGPASADPPGFVSMMDWPGKGDEAVVALRGRADITALSMQARTLGPTTREVLPTLTKLRWLNLTDTGATDDVLKAVAALPDLETLYLWNTKVTDAGMADLAGMPKLKELHLSRAAVTDAGARTLAGSKSLADLELIDTTITDEALKHLRGLPTLKRLDVYNTAVTGKGLAHLAGANLTHLRVPDGVKSAEALPHYLAAVGPAGVPNLEGWPVDDAGLALIARRPGVTWLPATGTFTAAGVKPLAGLTGLTNLSLDSPKLAAAAAAKHLAGLPKLTVLSLGRTTDDAALAEVAKLPNLTELWLEGSRVTDAGMKDVAKLAKLKRLSLRDTGVGDDGLMALAGMTELKFIDTTFSGVSMDGWKRFRARRPDCELYDGE